VFSQPQIEQAFSKFVTVRLHTDKVPAGTRQVPDAKGSKEMRDEKFKNFALPYYVVVRVKGNTLERVAFYEQGLINDVGEFTRFLQDALDVR
jgi:hypothetical protein